MQFYPIGELSRRSQVKIPTIRYYESVGLLPEPDRSASNRRVYTQDSLRRLNFIRRARKLGFNFDAIRQLQQLLDDPSQPCENAHLIAEHRLHDVEDKISQLNELKQKLQTMTACNHGNNVENCSIIEGLEHDSCSSAPN